MSNYPGGFIEINSNAHKVWKMPLAEEFKYQLPPLIFPRNINSKNKGKIFTKVPRKLKKKFKKEGYLLFKFTDKNLGTPFIPFVGSIK